MSIYIAYRHRKAPMCWTHLYSFQWTSERLVTTHRITEVSRQRIPSRWSSGSEGPTIKWVELVTWHKKSPSTGDVFTVIGLVSGTGNLSTSLHTRNWCTLKITMFSMKTNRVQCMCQRPAYVSVFLMTGSEDTAWYLVMHIKWFNDTQFV